MSELLLWKRLHRELGGQVDAFPGVAGVCVRDLGTDHGIAINPDEVFPTASTIKIHILAGVPPSFWERMPDEREGPGAGAIGASNVIFVTEGRVNGVRG